MMRRPRGETKRERERERERQRKREREREKCVFLPMSLWLHVIRMRWAMRQVSFNSVSFVVCGVDVGGRRTAQPLFDWRGPGTRECGGGWWKQGQAGGIRQSRC